MNKLHYPKITPTSLTWNHYLTEESKEEIKSVVHKDEDGHPIFDETIGRGVLDGVNTVIYTITTHFIGTLATLQPKYMTS